MILNELVSNSLKHAFPEKQHGKVGITLTQNEEGEFRLSVYDDGPGLPSDFDQRRRNSMGILLVERLVDQIGGSLQRHTSGSGMVYEIDFSGQQE